MTRVPRATLALPVAAVLALLSCLTPGPGAPEADRPSTPVQPKSLVAGDPRSFAGRDFSVVDKRARETPAAEASSIRRLVTYLIDSTQNELERVRALWVWEATHVAYDGRSFSVRDVPSLDAEMVFIRRKGVCIDYSVLFERLAMLAGIRAPVVVGVATGYPKAILLGDAGHAWNAVRIDGAWYLLDVTWSSGSLDEDFAFHYADPPDESCFLAEPALFVRSHLPEDPFWQLLPRPINMSTFLEIAAGK